jgi:uncharacterized protein YaaN involved in tellurite resistance
MDEQSKIPELTLTPNLDNVPTLEVPTVDALTTEPKKEAAPSAGPEMERLTPEEQKAVRDFAEKIDISDSNVVLQYGAGAQKNIADFSEHALESVRTKDMGEIGDMISGLVVELKGFNAQEETKGLRGLFRKANNSIESMKVKYNKVEANVDKIAGQLENHQITLMKDVALLDQMYDRNLDYYKQLTMYILAGRQKLEQERSTTLVQLRRPPTTMTTCASASRRSCTIWN